MAATMTMPQAQVVTGADLYADAGKPCCLCHLPLRREDAGPSKVAHESCEAREWGRAHSDWSSYEMTVPAEPHPTEGQVLADAYRDEIDF